MTTTQVPKENRSLIPVAIVALVVAAGGGAFWYFLRSAPSEAAAPALTAEGKAYVRHLKLGEVEMTKTESWVQAAVVEITGKITNTGDRTLRMVELHCVFYDPYGQLVLRQRVAIVRAPLAPDETRTFRLPFDNIPDSWNQALPQLVIANIIFG
jgi:hypothetical protein